MRAASAAKVVVLRGHIQHRALGLHEIELEDFPQTEALFSHFTGVKKLADLPASLASLPDADFAPAWLDTSAAPAAWRPIPGLGTATTLAPGAHDGFYITGTGAARTLHILTRHATVFAAFVVVKNTTQPVKAAVATIQATRARLLAHVHLPLTRLRTA